MSGQLDSYQSDFAQLHSPSFSISNFWTQGPLRKNHGPGVPSTGCFSASLEALVRLWSIDVNRRELDKSLQWKSLNEIPPHSQKLPETFDRILLLFLVSGRDYLDGRKKAGLCRKREGRRLLQLWCFHPRAPTLPSSNWVLEHNPFPLLLNVSQILKTRVRLKFWKFQTGQFVFLLIPFRKQINHEGPIWRFHPLVIKTSQPWGCFLGPSFKIERNHEGPGVGSARGLDPPAQVPG